MVPTSIELAIMLHGQVYQGLRWISDDGAQKDDFLGIVLGLQHDGLEYLE